MQVVGQGGGDWWDLLVVGRRHGDAVGGREEVVFQVWVDPNTLQLMLSLQQRHHDTDGNVGEVTTVSPWFTDREGH